MKNEMKMVSAYVSLRSFIGCGGLDKPVLDISFEKPVSTSNFQYKELCESQVAIPDLSQEDIEKIMAGAELEALQAAKKTLQAETHRKLMQIDERIGQLQALENKGQ